MLVTYIVHGNVVEFAVDFLDADDIPVEPDTAFVTVNFLIGEARVNETVELELDESDGLWRGNWPTDGADPGRVYWSAQSVNPNSAKDGFFDLTANLANLNAGASS